jgi:hypothetical protein
MPLRPVLVGALAASLLVAATGCQQPQGGAPDRLLIGEIMMHAEFAGNLRALAMPGGRLSGSPNGARAERLVAEKLRSYGLSNVHLEPFELACWSVHHTEVTWLSDPPRALEGAVALARTMSTPPDGVTAELIDVGEGTENDFAARGDELRGKYVLIRDGHGRRTNGLRQALAHGAAGLVVLSQPEHEPTIGNGHDCPRPEPAVVIRHAEELLAALQRGETVRLNIRLETENWDGRPNNVVGEIPGRGPLAKQVLTVCAHLDSWDLAEGALDNGSGAATILETARALRRVNWQPRRTIRFIWFMGEEQGLAGSAAYVRQHAGELDDIVAVINLDMPGAPRSFGIHGEQPPLESFLQNLRGDLAAYELNAEIGHRSGHGSDDASFADQGVSTISIGGEIGPGVKNYHTAGDKYEAVDTRGTVQTSAVLAVMVRRLADLPERLTVRGAPTTQPTN